MHKFADRVKEAQMFQKNWKNCTQIWRTDLAQQKNTWYKRSRPDKVLIRSAPFMITERIIPHKAGPREC